MMYKNYIFLALLFSLTINAQYLLNFDSFNNGNVSPQSPHIRLWLAAGVTDGQVTTAQAFSGTKSVLIRGNQTDDISMDLGNKTSGTWSFRWKMYVPAGKDAFWNIQNTNNFTSTAGAQWNGQFFIGNPNQNPNPGGVGFDQDDTAIADYPTDLWFDVVHVVNMDTKLLTVHINGVPFVVDHPYSFVEAGSLVEANTLGELNFYSINTSNEYFIDDFEFLEGNVLSAEDFTNQLNFEVYPNPATDVLNITSKQNFYNLNFEIVDLSGRMIISTTSNIINLSALNTGMFILNIYESNNLIDTSKILKK